MSVVSTRRGFFVGARGGEWKQNLQRAAGVMSWWLSGAGLDRWTLEGGDLRAGSLARACAALGAPDEAQHRDEGHRRCGERGRRGSEAGAGRRERSQCRSSAKSKRAYACAAPGAAPRSELRLRWANALSIIATLPPGHQTIPRRFAAALLRHASSLIASAPGDLNLNQRASTQQPCTHARTAPPAPPSPILTS